MDGENSATGRNNRQQGNDYSANRYGSHVLIPCRVADSPQSYTFLSKEGTGLHSENEAYAKLPLLTNPALDPLGKIAEIQVLRGQGREGRSSGSRLSKITVSLQAI